ncbi:PEP-CTERM protein-sorting domain-containing protein [Bradyrhizobium erythrophlei]|jgi:hypothetical protein|uniref:PEP-CTERM protein-sorting domain-containing protein n=1 Tax=Bradyrhizobium erythrophlei TaxID=1437360 RepID=A0A1M5YPC1_9BRAD|nr:PEPxxWA-CTERM sorting domain-containing protein [Bradyrhizobium erythrophlei]SHI13781.1 PEP-CTERM protein-sorting domain-containing protein [Bradyrhizobium erythrophlei]
MRNHLCAAAAFAAALISLSGAANAAAIEYTSAAAFDAATTGVTTYGVAGLAPADSYTTYDPNAHVGPVDFFSYVNMYAEGASSPSNRFGVADLVTEFSPGSNLYNLTVNTGSTTAIAFDFGTEYNPIAPQFNITLSTGDGYTVTYPELYAHDFIGFTSSAPITSVTFSNFATLSFFDVQLASDNVSAVPEPSTWAMMILGFAGLGFMACRRKIGAPQIA